MLCRSGPEAWQRKLIEPSTGHSVGPQQATTGARGLHQERGRGEEAVSSILSLSPDPDLLLGATSNILTHLQVEKRV